MATDEYSLRENIITMIISGGPSRRDDVEFWMDRILMSGYTLEEVNSWSALKVRQAYRHWFAHVGFQTPPPTEDNMVTTPAATPWKQRRVQKSDRTRYLLKFLLNYLEKIAPEDPAAVIQINWDGPKGFVTVTVTLDKGCLPNTPNGIMDAWLKTLGYGKPWVEAGLPGIEKVENTSTDMMLIRLTNWNVTICVDWAFMHTIMLSVF